MTTSEISVQEPTSPNASPTPRKVLIETWGCQMNVADSEQMLAMLKDRNYQLAESAEDADLVLLNTCHIREKAKHKVMSRLGRLREIQNKVPQNIKIAVTGCVAQAEGKKLLKEAGNIDMIIGPGKIDQLTSLLDNHDQTKVPQVAIGFKDEERRHQAPALETNGQANPTLNGKTEISRFINISQGCNNFCTFCVVPFTRGKEVSLHPRHVIAKAESLIASGAKEITLLGQNVNSYGHDLVATSDLPPTATGPFVDLLERVAKLDGYHRLRFTTSNPHDFTKPLADLYAAYPDKMGRYIHLPVQSGNDEILAVMKRKVTANEYLEKVQWLRAVDPEMALSTDLIVGFPGETEEQFADTLKLVEQVRYSFVYSFMYSPRKGTAAARLRNQIPTDVMKERLSRLNALQDRITTELNEAEIGRDRVVLCHYKSTKEPDIYYGRTEHFRLVRMASSQDLVGKLVTTRITEANKTALVGTLT